MGKYKAVIGLEMHCEIKSKSKVFSSATNGYNNLANIYVNAIDIALPGTLPVLNKECVRKSILTAGVLNCEIPQYMYFDRKNYYYPDLPKGYQITQMHSPVGINGSLTIDVQDYSKTVLIHDIHLEEDSAALEHVTNKSLINYNRAGVPLLELVTEPCFNSADEAVAFLEEMKRIYQYLDVSDADTKKGQVRCDVNVSIMDEDAKELGTKVEIKNVNSFSNVHDAINYEIKRQSDLKDQGRYDEVEQETRRWDEETNSTIRMRSKVDAIDYKYFVEPNIPKFKIDKNWIEEILSNVPELPRKRKLRYINDSGLNSKDASLIIKEKSYADYFDKCINLGIEPQTAANWLTGQILSYIYKYEVDLNDFFLKPDYLKEIIDGMNKGIISSKQAKEIFFKAIEEEKEPKNYINKDNAQISDEGELEAIIKEILSKNEQQIEEYKNGKTNLFDYFVGQTMKETRGKANPNIVKKLLNKLL